MKTLIITEKPSVAADFAKALGIRGKKDGYMDGGDTLITWAVGHLVELYEPQDYDKKYEKWSLADLPIIPDAVRYKPISRVAKQLNVIKTLLAMKDLDRVIIATDAGREGEVIARTVMQASNFKAWSKAFRFWTSQALTPQVVTSGLEQIKPASEYDRLWRAGQSRQIADWLVGMNGSRAATIRMRTPGQREAFSVGRVQTAVLALLVDRRKERDDFKPEPYWVLRAKFVNEKGEWWGTWFNEEGVRLPSETKAKEIEDKIAGKDGSVLSVKKERKKQPPPALYSLTDLQQDANRKYGCSAQRTLDIAQSLYEEKKCLSYPRTDSKVLGTQNVDMTKSIVNKLAPVYSEYFAGVQTALIALSNKRVFNDAKLTDHHALIPLAPLPQGASGEQKQIYELVLKRFCAAFHPDCKYEQTEIQTEALAELFRTRGKRILEPGWRAVYQAEYNSAPKSSEGDEAEEENLPPLAPKDPATATETDVSRKETTPPPEYTEALLLKDMTNPARYVSADELKKIFRGEAGLGTQATRAQIIETLLKRMYIERRRKYIIATDKGCRLIGALRQLPTAKIMASPEETARWEMQLEEIARGGGSDDGFIEGIKSFVTKVVEEFKKAPALRAQEPAKAPPDPGGGGKAPGLPKEHEKPPAPRTRGASVSARQGQPEKGARSTPSAKKTRSAQETQPVHEEPPTQTHDKPFIGRCPRCSGEIIEGRKGFGCGNWRKADGGCGFVIWKELSSKQLTSEMASELLKGKTLGPLSGFKSESTGGDFSASIRLEEKNGEYKVAFQSADESSAPTAERDPRASTLGKCPLCRGELMEGKKGFGCSNWRKADGGCGFVIWKTISEKRITPEIVAELIEKGMTGLLSGFASAGGEEFSGRLRLKPDGKIALEPEEAAPPRRPER